jgi:hypothetical protein
MREFLKNAVYTASCLRIFWVRDSPRKLCSICQNPVVLRANKCPHCKARKLARKKK